MPLQLLTVVLAVLAGSIVGGVSNGTALVGPFTRNSNQNMVPFNTTMPDGSVKVVWLHDSFQPAQVVGPHHQLSPRLLWHPGSEDDECGPSTFEDITTTGSANVADCLAVITQMLATPGYWYAYQSVDIPANQDWCRIAYHDSCVFGVRTADSAGTKMGTTDIADIMNTIIAKRTGSDLVQFEGDMHCNNFRGAGEHSNVRWAVFKPL